MDEIISQILQKIATLNEEVGGIQIAIAQMKSDIQWLKYLVGFVLAAIIGNWLTSWKHYRHYRNNNQKPKIRMPED